MKKVGGFDYLEVEFKKDGSIDDRAQVTELVQHVSTQGVTDLIVLAHGWNNDMDQARSLYEHLLNSVRSQFSGAGLDDRTVAVFAALWPSKRFAEEEFIAGGGASLHGPPGETELVDQLEDLKGTFDDPGADEYLEKAKGLVSRLEDDAEAQRELVDLIRSALPQAGADDEDASDKFFELPGNEVMARLAIPDTQTGSGPVAGTGGVATVGGSSNGSAPQGGATGIGDWVENARSAARNLLNFATYYQMKSRAGTVGTTGVYEVLRDLRSASPNLKLHLVGHSFGGRLVTAAATGPSGKPPIGVDSLALLQAAFSHYGFAENYEGGSDGFFRSMLTNRSVRGPSIVTHTDNDRAVGMAYPLASRIARQVAAGLGDANDRYGGIGRNGAQKTPEVVAGNLLASSGSYEFQAGRMHNLKSDDFIANHSDVAGQEVANAILAVIATT
ncbi:MAG: hypothetical protein ACRDJ2_11785 [Actinomycetota bacterium]